jgi:hypothetical protein
MTYFYADHVSLVSSIEPEYGMTEYCVTMDGMLDSEVYEVGEIFREFGTNIEKAMECFRTLSALLNDGGLQYGFICFAEDNRWVVLHDAFATKTVCR